MTIRSLLPIICIFAVLGSFSVHALYSSSDDVIDLTQSNFKNEVLKSDAVWIVEFYAPWCGHCKNLAPEYKKAATALKGVVKVGAVDMTQHPSVGGPYNVQGYPTIKIFGADKSKPSDFNSDRTASALVDAALSEARSVVKARLSGKSKPSSGGSKSDSKSSGSSGSKKGTVVELTEANFEEKVLKSDDAWLVEFFAPWCGHCKNLAPEWEKAAGMVEGKAVHLGAVDATVYSQLSSKYDVRGYPTIKVFKSGAKSGSASEATNYEGARSASAISSFALGLVEEKVEPKPIVEITSEQVFNEQCGSTLCLVSYLPHILDSKASGRQQYLKELRAVSAKYRGKGISFVWAEAGQQDALASALEIGGAGYPAAAIISAKKLKFTGYQGTFDSEGLNSWVANVINAKAPLISLQSLPKIDSTTPWDGKDGVMPSADEL